MERWNRVVLIAGVLAIASYAVFLRRNLSFAAGGPDSGGYMNEARLIAAGRMTRPVELVRVFGLDDSWLGYFMPLGFAPSKGAAMHATYPPGLPMHLALAARIGGWKHAPFYIAPLAAIGCLILMVAVATRLGVPPLLSFAGAAILGALPPFLWHAVQPASDVLATFWALLAIWFALGSRDRPWLAIAAGVAFAIGVWVRPTNVLLGFPLLFAVRIRWKSLINIAIGGLPFAVALMWWGARLYGSPFRTGYGAIDFSWAGAMSAAPQHAEWLLRFMSVLIFPAGLFVVFDRFVDGWTRAMLAVWFVVFLFFYSLYGFFDGWLCVRFLLPAIPALIIGTLLLVRDLYRLGTRWNRPVAAAIALLLVVWIGYAPIHWTGKLGILPQLKTIEISYPRYIAWAEGRLPRRAVIVTGVLSGPFLYYADRPIVRYDQLNDDRFQILRAYAGIHDLPWYAVMSDEEIDLQGLRQRFRGDWQLVDHWNDVTIYRLE
ncbi:MAG TPA: hypothetical protein VLV78_19140 [Thermoanaerobaculia bacterium]|nr:hypothetical protein [Thermoanaerobaculia bacterium]